MAEKHYTNVPAPSYLKNVQRPGRHADARALGGRYPLETAPPLGRGLTSRSAPRGRRFRGFRGVFARFPGKMAWKGGLVWLNYLVVAVFVKAPVSDLVWVGRLVMRVRRHERALSPGDPLVSEFSGDDQETVFGQVGADRVECFDQSVVARGHRFQVGIDAKTDHDVAHVRDASAGHR